MCLRPPDGFGHLPQTHVPLCEREREGVEVAEEAFPQLCAGPIHSGLDYRIKIKEKIKNRKKKRKRKERKKAGRSPSILTKVSAPLPRESSLRRSKTRRHPLAEQGALSKVE